MSFSSASHSLTRSSLALAHRSSSRTAFLASNAGATNRGHSAPSSLVTRSISSASVASGRALTGLSSPSWPNTSRAAEASTPVEPVTVAANSSSAAESTTPPPPAPPADGSATATPCRAATAATASSIALSTAAASGRAPSCNPPRDPPRTLVPSRVPRTSSTVTCLVQPSPSSHVLVTLSAIAPGRLPDGPRTLRSESLTASDNTGPNGL